MKKRLIFSLLTVAAAAGTLFPATAQQPRKPKLIVNIVVSQMRYDYLDRFGDNFGENGFRLFMREGVSFTNARHNYMMTNTPAGLATIATGANPSGHGVISTNWIDYTTKRNISLIEDSDVQAFEADPGAGLYSARNLTAATLGDRMKENDELSKVISIASSPVSAIVSGGPSADVYWMESGRGNWITSTYFAPQLPAWVSKYNELKIGDQFFDQEWALSRSGESYRNSESTIFSPKDGRGGFTREYFRRLGLLFQREIKRYDPSTLQYTPFGNTLVANFAREVMVQMELGRDEHTDLLTVCFDSPRLVGEMFGPRSVELEDMYYRLDDELGDLVAFIFAQYDRNEVIIVLTSDHGASDTFREESRVPMGQFSAQQFKIIMNGFLSAQYEPGEWILDYIDRQLYLNREMIYTYGFDLNEVQTRAAAFALQFRGVANAMTSTALQQSYFGDGYGERIQNSFYPKRSGDVIINLMPGWIEELPDKVSLSGSLYEYDTHVPLMFLGGKLNRNRVTRDVDMTSVAPTLARVMQMTPPNASTGKVLEEVAFPYEN